MSCACQIINIRLATEENVGNVRVWACCNHLSFITTPNQMISNVRTRYIFQRDFRKNISDFTDLHNEKNHSGSFV